MSSVSDKRIDSPSPDRPPVYQVKETRFSLDGTAWVKVAAADPRRVAVGFAADGAGCFLTTQPAEGITAAHMDVGINPFLWLYKSVHGPLCQVDWHARSGGGVQGITVFEIIRAN